MLPAFTTNNNNPAPHNALDHRNHVPMLAADKKELIIVLAEKTDNFFF